ncbi:MAG: N-acetylglucosamine-6-phosphate deacetylase [Lewinellaceae bacterium]|nr:N-acetylglucosamine-6-phosphate deacetylase [Lewinellaceae bacterium]
MQTTYINARVFTGAEVLERAHVTVENGLISHVSTGDAPAHAGVIDLQGRSIAPALIDLQVYGGQGKLFNNEPTVETIQKTYETVRVGGAAYFQITLSCSPLETMWLAIDACRTYMQSGGKGLLGLHLEGPYFNPEKRGAHPLQHIRTPNPDEVAEIIERGKRRGDLHDHRAGALRRRIARPAAAKRYFVVRRPLQCHVRRSHARF